jgi:hypothetical protein
MMPLSCLFAGISKFTAAAAIAFFPNIVQSAASVDLSNQQNNVGQRFWVWECGGAHASKA